jgi:acetyl-CoA synthetase
VADLEDIRAVALYLEAEGSGAKLAEALARCADQGIGVTVLKAGSSARGAAAATAHTGSIAGDARVFRALVEEAGGAWARNPHELLELAKALAYGRRTPGAGAAIVTCSGGDAAIGADEAGRLGVPLPDFSPRTAAALAEALPPTAAAANPLDYTAVIFGDAERTARLVTLAGADEAIGPVLVYYDRPADLGSDAAESWDGALEGIVRGAAALDKPVLVASTIPELMPEAAAEALVDSGLVPVAGLTEGILCAGALLRPPADGARLRAIGAAAARPTPGPWLAEHEAKALLREHGIPVPDGSVVDTEEDAVAAAAQLGGPVAVKLSHPDIRHKTELGGLRLNVDGPHAVRAAVADLRAAPAGAGARILVESMAAPGVELLLAVRRDGAIAVLVVALGGVWVELLDDAVLIPLPVDRRLVRERIAGLRGAPLLGGGRGRPAVDLEALCDTAVAVAATALAEDLSLVELNPVVAHRRGVTVVDAVIRLSQSALAPPGRRRAGGASAQN